MVQSESKKSATRKEPKKEASERPAKRQKSSESSGKSKSSSSSGSSGSSREKKKDPRLERAGVSGYNKPKRTPNHPTKYGIVVAKEGNNVKTIRFGQQGAQTNKTAAQREAFKSRHSKNIQRGKMSAAYWANKVRWDPKKTKSKKKS